MDVNDSPGTPSLHWPVLLALLGAGLVFHVRLGGLEPALWTDTVFDQRAVAVCLAQDRCLDRGVPTSVPGLRHGTTWLHWRTLAERAGLDLAAVHVLLHLAGALTFVLTALAAARVAGPRAGVGAALVLAYVYSSHDFQPTVVYNNRILPLLGTLAWALCVAALATRHVAPLVLAAAVGALTTEVHIVFLLFAACLLASALLLPRPGRSLAAVLGTYAALVVALSPGTWASNAAGIWRGIGPSPYTGGQFIWSPLDTERVGLVGVAALAAGLVVTRGERRRRIAVLLAFTAPIMVVFEAAVFGGVTTQTDKYLGAWLGGIAASLACGVSVAADRVREVLGRTWVGARGCAGLRGPLGTALQACLAAGIAFWPGARLREWKVPGDLPGMTMKDARRVAEAARFHGWTLERTIPRLRSLLGHDLIQLMPVVAPRVEPEGAVSGDLTALTVLRVRPAWLPPAMPPGWEVLDRGRESVLLAVWAQSWVDWDRFEVCRVRTGADPVCRTSGFLVSRRLKVEENQVLLPGWPWPNPEAEEVEVRLRVRFPPSGGEQWVFVPVLLRGCAGRVVAVPGAGSSIAPDGRSAVIRADGAEDGGTLALRWRVGDRDCSAYAWPYGIPFFVEAPPEDARLLEDLLSHGGGP